MSCCSPSRGPDGPASNADAPAPNSADAPAANSGATAQDAGALVDLPGGRFMMSNDDQGYPEDGEGPAHEIELSPFRISPVAVTNDRFAEFVDATGHVSEAERYGWSFVFAGFLPDEFPETRGV